MPKILKLTIVAFSLLALIGCSQEEKGEFYLPKTVTIYISDMDGTNTESSEDLNMNTKTAIRSNARFMKTAAKARSSRK